MLLKRIYANKKVLVTGHTGFKGSWLCTWLRLLGAEVYGVSDGLVSSPSLFELILSGKLVKQYTCDVSNVDKLGLIVKEVQPDFVFHLAAQALVKESVRDPIKTFFSNSIGVVSLLNAFVDYPKECSIIVITSDKVYDNIEWIWGYRENDRLGGKDPYSASKGMAEIAISSYVTTFFHKESSIRVAVARAGNVIGGGDWGRDRVVADCVSAWEKGEAVRIRNPNATRPWQHVLEPLSGYLTLGARLFLDRKYHGEAFNFGPKAEQNASVTSLIEMLASYWRGPKAIVEDANYGSVAEAQLLKLNCDKALIELQWISVLDFHETVAFTANWYNCYFEEPDTIEHFTIDQIQSYSCLGAEREVSWATGRE